LGGFVAHAPLANFPAQDEGRKFAAALNTIRHLFFRDPYQQFATFATNEDAPALPLLKFAFS
jgi:hypothetical protein